MLPMNAINNNNNNGAARHLVGPGATSLKRSITIANPLVSFQEREQISAAAALEFYDSIINNHLERLKRAVLFYRLDLNSRFIYVRKRNHLDLYPVHLVSFKGHLEQLQFLIANGSDVNRLTSTLRRQALHYAVLRHQMACAQMLMNAGADVNSRDTFGNSPIHYASEDANVTLISLLISSGAIIDSADITNKTPLMKAVRSCASGKISAVRKLVRSGANVNLKDKNDDTCLHFAAR